MAKDDGKIKSLIKLLEMFQDDPNLTDEGILIFEEIHNSESYQCEIKIFANLIFSQEYSFSSKFAKVYFDYESNYHSKKLDLVHLCIMTHMVNILLLYHHFINTLNLSLITDFSFVKPY